MSQNKIENVIETLSPLEKKIIPYLKLNVKNIREKTKIDEVSLLMALKFLENKEILKINPEKKKIIDIGTRGIFYKKNHLPERNLMTLLEKNNSLTLEEANKLSKLSENEFKASLGILKNKNLIEIKNGKVFLTASKENITKKTLEESFIEELPLEESSLSDDQKYAFEVLKKRKDILEIKEKNDLSFKLTELGENLAGKEITLDLIEELTPEIIKEWKRNKKFRRYDIFSNVPRIYGGKRHFVNEAIEYGKRIWLDLGFKEMTGKKTITSFWNFDALFTPQDHPARELHDTLFIKNKEGLLTNKKMLSKVKTSAETGINNSRGWNCIWKEDEAKRVLLRTHTTCLSVQTLSKLKEENLPAKYFAIGKCFRNETVDWSHGFEFNQTEGIVIDENANFRNLIGYLKEFAKKMGFEKIRFRPHYFPYTEPSLEGDIWDEERKQWVEVFAAGIFRPEVTEPLFGKPIPVLAWGPGFDRLIMKLFEIKDMRELYKNNLNQLRKMGALIK